jgi:two-component system, chemotaxis family, chemotaxis protein CheY
VSTLGRIRILVVDDNIHMRSLVCVILRGAGFREIFEATDGAHAFEVMLLRNPDLVIVDLSMSPIDGIEFTKMMRTASDSPNPFVPIIMMTGHTDRNLVLAARDAGINEFLAKPLSADTLLSRVVSVLDKPVIFAKSASYTGPCRRRTRSGTYDGPWRRQSDQRPNFGPTEHVSPQDNL